MIIEGKIVMVMNLARSLRLGGRMGGKCLYIQYSVCIYPVLVMGHLAFGFFLYFFLALKVGLPMI